MAHNLTVASNDKLVEGKLAKRIECACGYRSVWFADIGDTPLDVDETIRCGVIDLKAAGHDEPAKGPSEMELLKTRVTSLEAKLQRVHDEGDL